jgi:antitoxin VapB
MATKQKLPRAKVFYSGRSQAVRLPMEYRVTGREVYIRRDPETGEIILSPITKRSWDRAFKLIDRLNAEEGIPEDFMAHRDTEPADEKDLF